MRNLFLDEGKVNFYEIQFFKQYLNKNEYYSMNEDLHKTQQAFTKPYQH
jgi:hypothetical protein